MSLFNFKLVSLAVQVETVAQFGVVFLLFGLGLEFSLAKVFPWLILNLQQHILIYRFSEFPIVCC